jgi:hypothetical protein
MLKQITTLILISLFTIASPAFAETTVFTVSVTIPPHVMMAANDPGTQVQNTQVQASQETTAQTQQIVRNKESVTVRSIVVL